MPGNAVYPLDNAHDSGVSQYGVIRMQLIPIKYDRLLYSCPEYDLLYKSSTADTSSLTSRLHNHTILKIIIATLE